MKLKPCGTSAAYFRHIRKGETPCAPCRTAETRRRSQYPRRRGERMQRAWTMRDELADWLSLDGGWLTADGLASDFQRHPDSVWKVLRQLEDEGLVVRRVVELAWSGGSYESRTEWRLA